MTNSDLNTRLVDAITLLSVSGVGRGRYRRLIETFGTPSSVFAADPGRIEAVNGISRALANEIRSQSDREKARSIAARIIQLGWQVLFWGDADYPQAMANIADAPPILFRMGDAPEEDERMIAVVGTRHPTEKGRLFARNLAAALARAGITVVSGMAEGIDSVAHQGALEAGGKTVAVWGSSLDIVYPASNRNLAGQIMTQGALYSEYFPGTRPDRAYFPERNRIISGLSQGVVVIEAGRKSGALITARFALDQGRELFAVPGAPDAAMSEGCLQLIKHGARLITSMDDIFEELPLLKGEVVARKFTRMPDLTDSEKELAGLFAAGPLQIDELSRTLGQPVSHVMELLLAMELKGVVRELSGKRYALAE